MVAGETVGPEYATWQAATESLDDHVLPLASWMRCRIILLTARAPRQLVMLLSMVHCSITPCRPCGG